MLIVGILKQHSAESIIVGQLGGLSIYKTVVGSISVRDANSIRSDAYLDFTLAVGVLSVLVPILFQQ